VPRARHPAPLLLRFTDILKHRVGRLAEAFDNAIREHEYKGKYRCVYPIKVNQQRHVVEEILEFGKAYGFGLEAGSKPELLAVMALVDDDQTPIICNGFKDDEFIEAVILATKMGKNIIPVVEKFSELELIVKYAKQHNVKPSIGVRVKLSAKGAGRWEQSGGVRSKFGLFIAEVIDALDYLRRQGMGDCLNLLHFHLGSQINNIRNVKAAIIELVRVYTEMQRLGAGLKYIDVGGGLGVDYDGSKTDFGSSINYGLQEYANDVIFHVKEICDQARVEHPTIISESGRAMVAYPQRALVFNVHRAVPGFARLRPAASDHRRRAATCPPRCDLFDTFQGSNRTSWSTTTTRSRPGRVSEPVPSAMLARTPQPRRAALLRICSKVLNVVRKSTTCPTSSTALRRCSRQLLLQLLDLPVEARLLGDRQLFPIMPIHRLNEEPN
jgi:arginine decarboxylase